MRDRGRLWNSAWQWALLAILAAVVGVAGAWVQPNDYYTKSEVDRRIEREVDTLGDRVDRIDSNVQRLVDRLIEGEGK